MYKIKTFTLQGQEVLNFTFKNLPTIGQPWLTLDTSNSKITLKDTPTLVYNDSINIYNCWYDEYGKMMTTFFSSVNDAFGRKDRTLILTTETGVPVGYLIAKEVTLEAIENEVTTFSIDNKVLFFSKLNFQVIAPK